MPLTHVCVWDPIIGYRRISVEEASKLYPYEVSANGGQFVCELCAQNVGLSKARVDTGTRYFFHSSAAQNKNCEDRQVQLSHSANRRLASLNSHTMPLRISLSGRSFTLEIGFFFPPDKSAHCDTIRIANDSKQVFEYSFERIEHVGTTYLNVGSVPSRVYGVEYVNANHALKCFWSNSITGINRGGSFFDGNTGEILQPGGKAYSGNCYYLLRRQPVFSSVKDVKIVELSREQVGSYSTWYLYKIEVTNFSAHSARFFLKHEIFLTEKPTKFYPIWPAYIKAPYFICHNSSELYFYICGDDAELKAFPAATNVLSTQEGKLYKLHTRDREQLISLGKSGTLGFSYLIRQPVYKEAKIPTVDIADTSGDHLTQNSYSILPKTKIISVVAQFDGKAVVRKNDKIQYVYKVSAGGLLEIDGLSYGMDIQIFQGCDLVRTISFARENKDLNSRVTDEILVKKLMACSGQTMPVTHKFGAIASKYSSYPKTKQWIYKIIKHGYIPRSAYKILIKYLQETN